MFAFSPKLTFSTGINDITQDQISLLYFAGYSSGLTAANKAFAGNYDELDWAN